MRMPKLLLPVAVSLFVFACSSSPDGNMNMEPPKPTENPLITARPYESKVPSSYDGKKAMPLVVLLHGFGASGLTQDLLFGFSQLVDRFEFLYAYPDGTVDQTGKRFWNATEVCCDLFKTGVDDVAYVDAVIDDMSARYNVDKQRIFVIGHSNGGFMSLRYACDRANRVAAIMSLAGASYKDMTKCQPSETVAVLQVHGDMDMTVPFGGAMMGGLAIPSAAETVAGWANKNGCQSTTDTSSPAIDIESNLAGAETRVAKHPGCRSGGAAELWTIAGGSHVPTFSRPAWGEAVIGFLYAHVKPKQNP